MRPHETSPTGRTPEQLPARATPAAGTAAFEFALASAAHAPATARTAIAAWLAGHPAETILEDAKLVLGELVANSVRHADAPTGAMIGVLAEIRPDGLRVEVSDHGNGGVVARRSPDVRDGGGFGLNLVEALARRWGVDRRAGTLVWAELVCAGMDPDARYRSPLARDGPSEPFG